MFFVLSSFSALLLTTIDRLSAHDRCLTLRIYKDQDLLEVFYQGGRVAKTLRSPGGDLVAMVTAGSVEGTAMVWGMASGTVLPEQVTATPRLV